MTSNNDLIHSRTGGSLSIPQRRSSPQPVRQQMQASKQNESRRGDGNTRAAASSRSMKPSFKNKGSSSSLLNELEKAELAHAVLASFSVVPRGDRLAQYEPPRPSIHRRQSSRGKAGSKYGNQTRGTNSAYNGSDKPANLALNRFRFILSPASCYCEQPMSTLLDLSSAELWPHVVAVVACDADPLCSLCLDKVQAGRALPCGHIFCAVCIYRCLEAAASDPMLEKCPVCTEGELIKSQFRRCETKRDNAKSDTFSFVRSMARTEVPPLFIIDRLVTSRFVVATGEGMMTLIDKEREELAEAKDDLSRFRDGQGLQIVTQLETELNRTHVEWQRHVGKVKARVALQESMSSLSSSAEWTYQRSDGSLEFLHPVNLRCLLKHHQGDASVLPLVIRPIRVIESEEWADKKFHSMVKLSSAHLPDFPLSVVVSEVELEGMSEDASELVSKEVLDRARRREDRIDRKLKQQQKEKEEEATIEDRRRRLREEEELLLRAYFGYEDTKAEREATEKADKPSPVHDSFSAVVSNMGHFPVLGKSSPKMEPARSGDKLKNGSPLLEPLKGAWGLQVATSPASSAVSMSSTPPVLDLSFAQATTNGGSGKKKQLWSNNPSRREGS